MRLNSLIQSLKVSSVGLGSVILLSACSVFQGNDHQIKDSLFVWSDAFDATTEANRVTTPYQTIKALEENMAKSDVELLFESMVNHEFEALDLNDQEQPKAELKSAQELDVLKVDVPLGSAPIASSGFSASKVGDNVGSKISHDIAQVEIELETKVESEALSSVEDINRLTKAQPTAAGISVDQVLPTVKPALSDVPLTQEIASLATANDYQLKQSEFGMWSLAKAENSLYQEVCSLSSASVQLDAQDYTTQVWLRVVGDAFLVSSTTNIDISKPGVGIQFDDGVNQRFSKRYFRTSAVWSGDIENALNSYETLRLSLSGNELGDRIQTFSMGLQDLKRAYSEYQKCNRGTQIGLL